MQSRLTPANLAFGIGAVVTFIFSFIDFASFGPFGVNAWSLDGYAFVSTIPAILAIVGLVWMGLDLAGVDLPATVVTFTPEQMKVTWGISAAGVMLAFVAANDNSSAGFWLMLIGSAAMATGAILELLDIATNPVVNGPSPTSHDRHQTTPDNQADG